jgi:hypothetical protein
MRKQTIDLEYRYLNLTLVTYHFYLNYDSQPEQKDLKSITHPNSTSRKQITTNNRHPPSKLLYLPAWIRWNTSCEASDLPKRVDFWRLGSPQQQALFAVRLFVAGRIVHFALSELFSYSIRDCRVSWNCWNPSGKAQDLPIGSRQTKKTVAAQLLFSTLFTCNRRTKDAVVVTKISRWHVIGPVASTTTRVCRECQSRRW